MKKSSSAQQHKDSAVEPQAHPATEVLAAVSAHYHVLIMAGGVGSRFWPMSRGAKPKQFLDVLGTGRSLLQATYDRFAAIVPPERIYVATNESYVKLTLEQLPALRAEQIIAEPAMRNTAPCIALAAFKLHKKDPEAAIVVSPSDHLIQNESAFSNDILTGLYAATTKPIIMTLGIAPTRPDTGYGYIQFLMVEGDRKYYKVKTFTEKPSLDIAKSFLQSGDFLWNSGIFIFSAATMLAALQKFMPDVYDTFYGINTVLNTKKEKTKIAERYPTCKNISIDYGVMEKANNVYVVKSVFGWNDLGTWNALYDHIPQDPQANATTGKVRFMNAGQNIVRLPEGKLGVIRGVNTLIVVDTGDVLFICPRNQEQAIREVVNELRELGDVEYL